MTSVVMDRRCGQEVACLAQTVLVTSEQGMLDMATLAGRAVSRNDEGLCRLVLQ